MTGDAGAACGDERMQAIIEATEESPERGVEAADRALIDFPEDARLHFVRGSLLIGLKRFHDAHAALVRAVDLAPEFHLARFQLGFFELTSGEAEAARASWAPLKRVLPPEHHLVRFADGLEALMADRFADCIETLNRGIDANRENLPLNHDMELIVEKCRELLAPQSGPAGPEDPEQISATSFLLGARRN